MKYLIGPAVLGAIIAIAAAIVGGGYLCVWGISALTGASTDTVGTWFPITILSIIILVCFSLLFAGEAPYKD